MLGKNWKLAKYIQIVLIAEVKSLAKSIGDFQLTRKNGVSKLLNGNVGIAERNGEEQIIFMSKDRKNEFLSHSTWWITQNCHQVC